MASTDASPPRTWSTGASLLLTLACLLYIAMMFFILGSEPVVDCGDPASCVITKGLGDAFEVLGGFCTLLLWIVLAFLLFAGGIKEERTRSVAAILLPLSGIAAIVAGVFYSRYGAWSIIVPALLPPLVSLYALWTRLPALHATLPAKIVNVATGGAILILTIAPVPLSAIDASSHAGREAKTKTSREQWVALEHARNTRFLALTPDSPLADFLYDLKYSGRDIDWPPDVAAEVAHHYDQALAKARQVKTRQTDAVVLLETNQIFALKDLWQLDIEATPALCTAYRERLREQSATWWADLLRQLPNIKWLVGEHCDLDAALADIATSFQNYCPADWCPGAKTRDDRDRIAAFTAALAALRRAH